MHFERAEDMILYPVNRYLPVTSISLEKVSLSEVPGNLFVVVEV